MDMTFFIMSMISVCLTIFKNQGFVEIRPYW